MTETLPRRPIRAVTFDFWNTLICQQSQIRDRRLQAWLGILEGEGLALERSHLDAAYGSAWKRFDAAWKANLSYSAYDAVRDCLAHLGLAPPPDVVKALVEVVTDPDPTWSPEPTPHVEMALAALSDAGVKIGIICDVGLSPSYTLRRYLTDHGLMGYFDHWSFSDEVGTFKPDARIFHHALEGLGGFAPAETAHIGDLRRTDVAGAQSMGIFAVRYRGVADDKGSHNDGTLDIEGDAVVSDHRDLAAALGLA